MVVIITSTGGVTKKVFTFDRPIDQGLAAWAGAYLNERLEGVSLGARTLHSRLADPSLNNTELDFLERLAPAFTELADTAEAGDISAAHILGVLYRDRGELEEAESWWRRAAKGGHVDAALLGDEEGPVEGALQFEQQRAEDHRREGEDHHGGDRHRHRDGADQRQQQPNRRN